jgi:hypothetical protein
VRNEESETTSKRAVSAIRLVSPYDIRSTLGFIIIFSLPTAIVVQVKDTAAHIEYSLASIMVLITTMKDGTSSASTSTGASAGTCSSIEAFPAELLESVLLYTVQTPRDLVTCALICKAFAKAAYCTNILWRAIAVHRYGLEVAEASETLYCCIYDNDWKFLVTDNNMKGALPTLSDPKPCYYSANRTHYFFCCLIVAVKWNRSKDQIRIYIDARGESDLPPPYRSSIHVKGGYKAFDESEMAARGQWVSELSEEESRPGHYKGYLAFPPNTFMAAGTYMFCYDDRLFHHDDDRLPTMEEYGSVPIMTIPARGELADAFISNSRAANTEMQARQTYSTRASPFAKDTPEIEHARWKKWVSKETLERHTKRILFFGGERQPQWWV